MQRSQGLMIINIFENVQNMVIEIASMALAKMMINGMVTARLS